MLPALHSPAKYVAAAASSLAIAKSNDVGGSATFPTGWNWLLTIANTGAGDAVFADTNVIAVDTFPGNLSFGVASAGSFVNITNSGNISLSIVAGVLTVTASGAAVTIGATTGSLVITIPITPDAAGTYTNTGSGVIVDPNSVAGTPATAADNTVVSVAPVIPTDDCLVTTPPTPFQADYQLVFTDPETGEPIDIIPVGARIHSLKYVLKINDIGSIRFTVDVTDRIVDRIINREDILCDVLRRNRAGGDLEVEKTFFMRFWDIFEEDRGRESIIFGGVSLEDLFRRRLIVPDDDLFGAAGFSTKSGLADIVMRDYVRDQCVNPFVNIARKFPGLLLAPFTPDTLHQTFQRRKQEHTLLEVLQDVANTSNVDFQIFRDGGNRLVFLPQQIGEDRTATRNEFALKPFVLFSTKRANIEQPRIRFDRRKEETFVYVASQGIEEDRIFTPVGSTAAGNSRYNRIEALIDSRDDETIDEVLSSGAAEIQKELGRKAFDWEVAFGQAQSQYNVDWSLGDYVTAEHRDVRQDFRLEEMQVTVDEKGEKLIPKFEQEF